MGRWGRLPVLILGLLVVVGSVDVPRALGQADAQVAPDAEAQFVSRINDLRRSKGLAELTVDGPLVGLARRWAASMAAAGAISHNPDLRREVPEPWQLVGENVGVGPNVESLHEAFVASASHYRNLVEPRFTRIGVGVVRTADGTLYTTHLFLQPAPPPVRPRAARSRASAARAAKAAAPTVAATTPLAVGDAMTWRSLLRPAPTATVRPASVSLADGGSGAGVPPPLLLGALLAVGLIVLARRLDRRRAALARRGTTKRADTLATTLGRYTATTAPALPLTTGLRWMPAHASSLDEDDVVADGELAATLAPYAVSRVVARWRLEELVDELDGVVIVAGRGGRVRYASPATERTLGHAPGALAGLALSDFVHADDTPAIEAAAAGESRVGDVRLRHRDGSWRHVEVEGEDRRADPGIAGIVLRGADVTERRAVEAEMRNRVEHDPVTGLLGRPTLLERLGHAIERIDDGGDVVVVLAVRLEGLDVVHEAHGPVVVDCLIAAAADRLQHDLGPAAVLGRYGDHDFAVVVAAAASDGATVGPAQAALDVLRAPFVALAEPVTLVPSVGVAVVERPDIAAAQALQHAFVAMRAAQRLGGDRVEPFTASLRGRAVSRLEDERALRRALEQRELCVQYQPIVRASTGTMTGVEALLRWEHPQRGLVPAAEFIGVAEEAGFVGELSWWALRTACIDAARWARLASTFRVSVNVAARQLTDPAFADLVVGALADVHAPPASLCLELTEASLLDDIDTSAQRLQTVRDLGVTVAVDDFGTGYSSLGYLQHLPIDTVKIDRSFVADIGHTRAGDTIASAVVGLAHGLGLGTVAEGVETEAQAGALATIGCDQLQGYLCSPARPAVEIDGLIGTPLIAGMVDLRGASANSAVSTR